jgi:hypothetical protein
VETGATRRREEARAHRLLPGDVSEDFRAPLPRQS